VGVGGGYSDGRPESLSYLPSPSVFVCGRPLRINGFFGRNKFYKTEITYFL
jgi:hypothetical protein